MIGRLLRQKMQDETRETSARVAERIAARRAAELGVADREAKYPVMTAENALEAIRYQEERIKFHMEASK